MLSIAGSWQNKIATETGQVDARDTDQFGRDSVIDFGLSIVRQERDRILIG